MLNKIILIGRLTADVERFKTEEGTKILSFGLAVDQPVSGEEKNTLFINCKCFNKTAEACSKVLHKGSLIAIQGRLQMRRYINKDSVQVTTYEVLADGVEFLDPKEKDPNVGDVAVRVAQEKPAKKQPSKDEPQSDNLPF